MDLADLDPTFHQLETLKLELSTSAILVVAETVVVKGMEEAMMAGVEATQPHPRETMDFIMAKDILQDRATVKLES